MFRKRKRGEKVHTRSPQLPGTGGRAGKEAWGGPGRLATRAAPREAAGVVDKSSRSESRLITHHRTLLSRWPGRVSSICRVGGAGTSLDSNLKRDNPRVVQQVPRAWLLPGSVSALTCPQGRKLPSKGAASPLLSL
jgi:hypothetical protein